MCGIAGIITQTNEPVQPSLVKKMTDALAHRGPNGEGCWVSPGGRAGLGHRRLSVIDLSAAAAQPMRYPAGGGTREKQIVHNGEIYNYIELRAVLAQKGYRFATASDTEVILAAYDCYKEDCLRYLDGMFAFAIWDEAAQTLFAARDRFGEKPFYYHYHNGGLYFASEMKALWAAGIAKETDNELLLHYLALGHNQLPLQPERSFYKNIFSLPPGHYLQWNLHEAAPAVVPYYDLDKQHQQPDFEVDVLEVFKQLLQQSVKTRLRSDVPVGTSLSGGLDSSAIAAFCRVASTRQYTHHCFTAVFPGYEKDESAYAAQAAAALQLQQHTVTPTGEELVNDLDRLLYHHEQPVLSASVYAQYRVFRLAKEKGVTVLLDGQGADELLGGYHRYIHWFLQDLYKHDRPRFNKEIADLRGNGVPFTWGLGNTLATLLPQQAAQRLEKREIKTIRRGGLLHTDFVNAYFKRSAVHKPNVLQLNDMLYFNTRQMGLEELLRYADRNSMAHGLEVRLPFLNHRLAEFIFSLPPHYKIRGGFTKWILRQAVNMLLPTDITWRTNKIGFEPPQAQWMHLPVMQAQVREAKQALTTAGILNKPQPGATINTDVDWRILCAARLL
jgi:asparagine synthase (glutamine-hydrolysing)